jgi:hypothetical protein
MSLSLKSQALAYLLKGGFHLPAPHKPRDDPLWVGTKIGAKECLGPELCLGVSDQDPTQRHGRQSRAVPDSRVRDSLYGALLPAVPVGHRDGPPQRAGIFGYNREVGQPLAFEARSSHLMRAPWWGRFVKGGIQAQAGDEGDRMAQLAAALEQPQRGVGAIGDGYSLSLCGYQRLIKRSSCQAQSVSFLCRLLCSLA